MVFLIAAPGLGYLLAAPPFATALLSLGAVVQGVMCAGIMILAMAALDLVAPALTRKVAQTSVRLIRLAGIKLSWPAILVIAAAAGVGEEAFFRGFLQAWLSQSLPLWLAVLMASAVFTVLHFYSVLYIVLVMGIAVFLGIAYAVTENILVVIIAHGLYDIYGLFSVRRAMDHGVGMGSSGLILSAFRAENRIHFS